jgi:hypothetical protein
MKTNKLLKTLVFTLEVAFVAMLAATVYAAPNNMPAEITTIRNGTEGYINGICYLVGTSSAAVGVWKFVESQSLKVAGLAGTVTILSFKFPAWVIAAAVI